MNQKVLTFLPRAGIIGISTKATSSTAKVSSCCCSFFSPSRSAAVSDMTESPPDSRLGADNWSAAEPQYIVMVSYLQSAARVQRGRRSPTFGRLGALGQIQRVVVFVIFAVFSPCVEERGGTAGQRPSGGKYNRHTNSVPMFDLIQV